MPDAPRARDRRAWLLGVLVAHGLAPVGAQALWRMGVALRARTLQTKREYGAFVDAETGAPFGDVLSADGDELEAGPLLRAMPPGRRYAAVHTHPEGFSFSATDALVLVAHAPTLRTVAAVGGHGVWYVLSLAPDREPPALEDVFAAFRQERDALAPAYQRLMEEGALTRRAAQREHSHTVWERIAPALGLRYDRV